MSLLAQFEHPLPRIQPNTERIIIETAGGCDGSFVVENAGGSELSGRIASNLRAVTFSPETFQGNRVKITYTLNPAMYRQGDAASASALIVSNGGEAVIPIEIRIVPPAVTAKDGTRISTLEDFLAYARAHPVASRQLFTQHDFMAWLMHMQYEHMEMYEHFTRDPNKERAVDHFLILNKLKQKACVAVGEPHIKVSVKPDSPDETGVITLTRSAWGFLDIHLHVPKDVPWLKLGKERLTSADFNEQGAAEVFFIVVPPLLAKRRQTARVSVVSEGERICEVCVTAICQTGLAASANKEAFGYEDEGVLFVTNHTGADLMIEVAATDSFIKFEGKKYFIGAYAEIPFEVRMSGLQTVQASLKNRISTASEIQVRAKIGDRYVRERVLINISGLA